MGFGPFVLMGWLSIDYFASAIPFKKISWSWTNLSSCPVIVLKRFYEFITNFHGVNM
jgi:hypothetical protein